MKKNSQKFIIKEAKEFVINKLNIEGIELSEKVIAKLEKVSGKNYKKVLGEIRSIKRYENNKPVRIDGKIISNYKATILKDLAKEKGLTIDELTKNKKLINDYMPFIEGEDIIYVFSDDNFEDYLKKKKIKINGQKYQKGEAVILIQEFISSVKNSGTAYRVVFNTLLKNQQKTKEKGLFYKDIYKNLEIHLPPNYDENLHGSFNEYMEEIIYPLEGKYPNVQIYLSEQK